MADLNQIGWDPLETGKYAEALKPKITLDEILEQIDPQRYTKQQLRRLTKGRDIFRLIMRAQPRNERERQILGLLTSLYAESQGGVTLYRPLDYIGRELEMKHGMLTVVRLPGQPFAAGKFAGEGMRDGAIIIEGDADEGVGHSMQGGIIQVEGTAASIGPTLGGTVLARAVFKPIDPSANTGVVCIGDFNSPEFQLVYQQRRFTTSARAGHVDALMEEIKQFLDEELRRRGKS